MPKFENTTRVHETNGHGDVHSPRPKARPLSAGSNPKQLGQRAALDNVYRRLADNPQICAAFERLQNGTDDVLIGSSRAVQGETDQLHVLTMADAAKLVGEIKFLVRGWVPLGMLTMIVAEPGKGKSAFALYGLAGPVITGCEWFTGANGPPAGFVLWIDTEGTTGITVDRIKKGGLPAEQIVLLDEEDVFASANLEQQAHLDRIEAIIHEYQTKLVVIDSFRGSHTGDENSSKVAGVLQALAGIAARTNAAIVLIHHTRKLFADEEVSARSSRGSNAIYAMVRSQIGIDRPDEQSDWSRLLMLKENLGLRPEPVGFRFSANGLEFGPAPQRPRRETQKDNAREWLLANMKPGRWYAAGELTEGAAHDGLSETALRRARNDLGIVKPHVRKTKQGWQWKLPVPGEARASGKTPAKTEAS